MANKALSAAMKEAIAVAHTDRVILQTLELRHPGFVNEEGANIPLRVVSNSRDPIDAKLEASAPVNGGDTVRFLPFPFEAIPPGERGNESTRLQIVVSAVLNRLQYAEGVLSLDEYLEQAIADGSPLDCTYRLHLSNDLATAQLDPALHFQMESVTSDDLSIRGTAVFPDEHNRRFPADLYDRDNAPLLFTV